MKTKSDNDKARMEKNSEVGKKGTKERGVDESKRLVIINSSPFGAHKKRLGMMCQTITTVALMVAIYADSDGTTTYVHALWLTGTVGLIGFFNLLFASME